MKNIGRVGVVLLLLHLQFGGGGNIRRASDYEFLDINSGAEISFDYVCDFEKGIGGWVTIIESRSMQSSAMGLMNMTEEEFIFNCLEVNNAEE